MLEQENSAIIMPFKDPAVECVSNCSLSEYDLCIPLNACVESQYSGDVPPALKPHVCGPVSIYNALSVLEFKSRSNFELPIFSAFVKNAVTQCAVNCPYYYYVENGFGEHVNIIVAYSNEAEVLNDLSANFLAELNVNRKRLYRASSPNVERVFGFSLDTGWDNRGTLLLLQSLELLNINISQKLNLKIDRYSDEFNSNFIELMVALRHNSDSAIFSTAITSIDPKFEGWSISDKLLTNYQHHKIQTHIISLLYADDTYVYFADSAIKPNNIKVKKMPIFDFYNYYRGTHTIFSVAKGS